LILLLAAKVPLTSSPFAARLALCPSGGQPSALGCILMLAPIDSLGSILPATPARPGCHSGWRCEGFGSGPEPGATVGDVVRHEREELGKDIFLPQDLIRAMDEARLWAGDVVWVCASPQEVVLRYGEGSITGDARDHDTRMAGAASFAGDTSEATEVVFGPTALILGTDDDGGWLVLHDASLLEPGIVERFKVPRRALPSPLVFEAGL